MPTPLLAPMAAFVLLLPNPADAAGGVEPTLRGLERAVLAADAGAGLGYVVPAVGAIGDPVFRREMMYWLGDLARKPVEEIELRFEPRPNPAAERVEGELWISWRMRARESEEPAGSRSVNLPAAFVLDPESGRWLYAGEAMESLEGDAVRVLFPEEYEEAAREIIEVFPDVRERVLAEFADEFLHDAGGDPVPEVQVVKIYASMPQLQASIALGYDDPLAGWNEPGESIKLLASALTRMGATDAERRRQAIAALLAHEYGHVVSFALGPKATDAPWWTLEGIAEFASSRVNPRLAERTLRTLRRSVASGGLVAWEKITDFYNTDPEFGGYAYSQGLGMMLFVTERSGPEARTRWLHAIAQGEPLDEATRQALGVGFDELDREWREWLRAETPQSTSVPQDDTADVDSAEANEP